MFLAEWVLDGYEAGGSKNEYSWAISAIQKIHPRVKLKVAWRVLDAWTSLVPVKQAPAAPPELLQAMVVLSLVLGRPQLSMVMLLAYTGLLRIREALSLKAGDLILQGRSVIICLGRAKGGLEQKVILTNPSVVDWVRQFLLRFPPKHPLHGLFSISYSSALRWVRRLAELLGAGQLGLSTHSFRRSGASELSRQGMPLSDILLYGRWLSERAAREYVRKGEVAVIRAKQIISGRDWKRVTSWSLLGPQAWSIYSASYGDKLQEQRLIAVTVKRLLALERVLFSE